MPRKPAVDAARPRTRRTAEQARSAILDAAQKRLVADGPNAIRLQEVAADVGVSHPTVLHHFGSREGLVEAVVLRARDSLHAVLVAGVRAFPGGSRPVEGMLDRVFEVLADQGHGRALLWLALSGYVPSFDELRVRAVAEVVHDVRREQRRASGKRAPPFEDTYFTVLLPALALLSLSVLSQRDDGGEAARFRAWLARLIGKHLRTG